MTEMTDKPRKRGRRHPLATLALIGAALLGTGGAYALATIPASADDPTSTAALVAEGEKLFDANCASCHGLDLTGTPDGPSLIGVGAAAVDFQVGTGRMPMAMTGPQAMVKPPQFTKTQIAALAAYVASLSPGPAIPSPELVASGTDLALGGELFRINCAMCHNVVGAGGALTEGKFAPQLMGVDETHIWEAMLTGPQNMPVFNDANITPEDKANIIAYLKFLENQPAVGGYELGGLGPVAEGLFIWIFGLGALVGVTIWLTSRSN
ncbi:MAG TPA: cytochrome c [Microbacteriaceae bacterium]|nr:cytochrome c [Microbacteriaceae bacterium]